MRFLIEISIRKRDDTKEAEMILQGRSSWPEHGFKEAVQTDKEGSAFQVRKTGLVTQRGVLEAFKCKGKSGDETRGQIVVSLSVCHINAET